MLPSRLVVIRDRNGSIAPDVAFGVSILVLGGKTVVDPGAGEVSGPITPGRGGGLIGSLGTGGFKSVGP